MLKGAAMGLLVASRRRGDHAHDVGPSFRVLFEVTTSVKEFGPEASSRGVCDELVRTCIGER